MEYPSILADILWTFLIKTITPLVLLSPIAHIGYEMTIAANLVLTRGQNTINNVGTHNSCEVRLYRRFSCNLDRETQITMVKWTNAGGQTKRANERSFVYRPLLWRRWRNVKTRLRSDMTYQFAQMFSNSNLIIFNGFLKLRFRVLVVFGFVFVFSFLWHLLIQKN